MKKYLLIFSLFFLVLMGCHQDKSVSKIIGFENNTWQRFNFLNFEFQIEDISKSYDFLVLLRYDEKFTSEALIINFVMTLPSGEERIKEYKLNIRDKTGELLGEKKTGYYERFITIRREMKLDTPGLLEIEIECLMHKYYTPGIVEFGIVVEPSE